jgi:hypothetical protein
VSGLTRVDSTAVGRQVGKRVCTVVVKQVGSHVCTTPVRPPLCVGSIGRVCDSVMFSVAPTEYIHTNHERYDALDVV